MARRPTAKERWERASTAALKLEQVTPRPRAVRSWPAITPETDAKTALRIARRVFGRSPPELAAAWNEANGLYKPMQRGLNRTATRRPAAQWTGSNDPLIVFIALWGPFPDLLTKPLGRRRIDAIMLWLHTPAALEMMAPKLRRKSWDEVAIERAIRRAKNRPQLVQLIGELQATK